MKDKAFIDTNIILYAYSEDEVHKQQIANLLIFSEENPMISNQVISEISNILFKKFKLDFLKIEEVILELTNIFTISPITLSAQIKALRIKEKYSLQYYDSLIIATAIENKCTKLYSEDLQDKQLIDNQLLILNPFT